MLIFFLILLKCPYSLFCPCTAQDEYMQAVPDLKLYFSSKTLFITCLNLLKILFFVVCLFFPLETANEFHICCCLN